MYTHIHVIINQEPPPSPVVELTQNNWGGVNIAYDCNQVDYNFTVFNILTKN